MNIRISRLLLLGVDGVLDGTGQPIFRNYVVKITDHAFIECMRIFHPLRIKGGAGLAGDLYENQPVIEFPVVVPDLDPTNPQGQSDFLGAQSFYKSYFSYKNTEAVQVFKTPSQVTDQASLEAFCADVSGITARLVISGAGLDEVFNMDVQQLGYIAEITDAVSGRTTTLASLLPMSIGIGDIWHCFSDNAEDYYTAENTTFTFVNHSDSRSVNILGQISECPAAVQPPEPEAECCEDIQAMIDPVLKDKTIHPSIRSAVAAGVIRNKTGNSVPAVAHLGAKLMSAVFKAADPDGKQGVVRDNHGIEI